MKYLTVGITSGIAIGVLVALGSIYALPFLHSLAPGC